MTGVRWSGGGGPKAGIGVGPEIGKGGCVRVVDGGSSERSARWFWFGKFACGAGDAHIECVTTLAQSQRQKSDVDAIMGDDGDKLYKLCGVELVVW